MNKRVVSRDGKKKDVGKKYVDFVKEEEKKVTLGRIILEHVFNLECDH